jgi:hypothetical protein
MDKFVAWINGKRTYIIAILTGVFGVLQAFGIVVPEFVYIILAAFGLTFVRSAIKK